MPEDEDIEAPGDAVDGRPIWSGTVSFGLVSVPVDIVSTTVSRPVALHMVSGEGRPLRRKYFRAADDVALNDDDIVRGYEYEKGKFVPLEDDELDRLAPERTRDIDLRVFVDVASVDPTYFVRAYILTPVGSPKAYALLARVMEERGRAGIATFVMRAKEYVAAIFAQNGVLRLETLRLADEIRLPSRIGLPEVQRPPAATVKRIEAMVKRLTKPTFDRHELDDRSAEQLETLAKRKARAGEDVVAVSESDAGEATTSVVDLMERLQQSLRGGAKDSYRKQAAGR